MSPPLGLTGNAPPRAVTPASTASPLHPGLVSPKWSIAMYCEMVKQSWVSIPSRAKTSATPARANASVIAPRTCGNTYSASALASSLSTRLSDVLRCPQPAIRAEEHTSELQSLRHLVCRLLLEK